MLEPFTHPYVQRGVVEIVLLAVGAGVLGTWIVLRGLAFFSHAVGTAAFPGLVLADGLGFAAGLGAFATAALFAGSVERLARRRASGHDALTAIVLAGCLAAGVILASDVFHSGSNVETLLFGSLLLIDSGDVAFAGGAAAVTLVATFLLGRRWLVTGFDPDGAAALGVRGPAGDLVLLFLVALTTTAALSALGALLVTALFVVPAATTRLLDLGVAGWQRATVALVAVEGVVGVWLSAQTDAPPGATIAALSAGVFVVAAVARLVPRTSRRALAATALLAVGIAGCGSSSGGDAGKLDVVATTTQLGDLVRQVGGASVDVHQILKPNSDPHDYEPRPSDVDASAGAKVVFESGDGLDRWMGKVVSQGGGDPNVVVVGDHVPVKLAGEASGPEASRLDPHWWHDPANFAAAAKTVRDALTKADPHRRADFTRNADRYLRRLSALRSGVKRCLATVPVADRKLVTDHDAFNYFARAFGITVVGAVIPSQTTQAQPSAGGAAKLAKLIRRERVKAVFPESSLNPKLAKALARETGARADYTLYGDTLGPRGSAGATYLTMEQANADAMVRGFTGNARGCRIGGLDR